jgi:hypothetical protein
MVISQGEKLQYTGTLQAVVVILIAQESLAKAVRDHVDGRYQHETLQKLAAMLLMTYAMRNSDRSRFCAVSI